MQKRYQVLLPDWLEEYIKWGVKKYSMSFSELIRLEICLAVINTITQLYPHYQPNISLKNIHNAIKKHSEQKKNKEEMSKIASHIYFEARKAIEYRLSKEKASSSSAPH